MTAIKDTNILSGIKPFLLKILAEINYRPYKTNKVMKLKKNLFNKNLMCYNIQVKIGIGGKSMKHIQTLNGKTLKDSMKNGGCGECQTSCQSACKTSCTVANQSCQKK